MPEGNDRFNADSASWDARPFVHAATAKAWSALCDVTPDLFGREDGSVDVLEIGCGTGILTLRAAARAHSITAVDSAEGMIDVLKGKLSRDDETHASVRDKVVPLALLLTDSEDAALPADRDKMSSSRRLKYDLVLSHLVLHHIADLRAVLQTMLACLKPGGRVALTDFEDTGPEARRFHAKARMAGVERHGIRPGEFAELMKDVGFKDVKVERAWTMSKAVERLPEEESEGEGEEKLMDFPFVLCLGTKAM